MAPRRRLARLLTPLVAPLLAPVMVGSMALLVTACGTNGADGTDASAPVATAGSAETAGTEAVPAALQFSAPLVGGGSFDGSDYGDRPVAFWFWAPT
jgi:hypothetical protein